MKQVKFTLQMRSFKIPIMTEGTAKDNSKVEIC
jgi:hypothetical protein